MESNQELTVEDLRAAIARHRIKRYRIAGRLDVHPATLTRILHGQKPLTSEMAMKIIVAIEALRAHGPEAPPRPAILAGEPVLR